MIRQGEAAFVDSAEAWQYFRRKDLHKLSAVDATSFALMVPISRM